MPCYEPDPPYLDGMRANEKQAVKILCAMTESDVKNQRAITLERLEWYIVHRKIDLQIADYHRHPKEEKAKITESILRAEMLLKSKSNSNF